MRSANASVRIKELVEPPDLSEWAEPMLADVMKLIDDYEAIRKAKAA
jgi:hypothetical protein